MVVLGIMVPIGTMDGIEAHLKKQNFHSRGRFYDLIENEYVK